MRTRLRLGAVTVVALGALLLATALASPAFAWDATVEVKTTCLDDGRVKVTYTVTAFEAGHAADVHATYNLGGGSELPLPSGELDAEGVFEDNFVLDAGTTGTVVVFVTVDWEDSDEFEFPNGRADLPENCGQDTTTTSSSIEDTTSTSEKETTTSEKETTTSEVLGETSTTAVGLLPFTGASSGPMLLAGIGLVAGGLLFLWSSRTRNASR
jgi:hypothetical protein